MVEYEYLYLERCPRCGEDHPQIEEVMADVTVASEITLAHAVDGDTLVDYGDQTNSDGHVVRYQSTCCGYVILGEGAEDDEKTQMGLDEHALAAEIRRLNSGPQRINQEEVAERIAAGLKDIDACDLVNLWQRVYPNTPIVFNGADGFTVGKGP